MRPSDHIEKLFADIEVKTNNTMDKVVRDDAVRAMSNSKTSMPDLRPDIWRIIMKIKMAKPAAAALILVGALVLTSVFVETNKNVALAGVLERVEQTHAYKHKVDITCTIRMNPKRPATIQRIKGTVIASNEYGTKSEMNEKWESHTGIPDANTNKENTELTYVLPNQKLMYQIKPGRKQYVKTELDDDYFADMKDTKNDPRKMLKRMLECEYTKIGRTVLDGIDVEGFETTDPNWTTGGMTTDYEEVRVSLWVDVETWLPVLWETETKINEQLDLHTVLSDFEWDIPVSASDFEPVIPEDYTPKED